MQAYKNYLSRTYIKVLYALRTMKANEIKARDEAVIHVVKLAFCIAMTRQELGVQRNTALWQNVTIIILAAKCVE